MCQINMKVTKIKRPRIVYKYAPHGDCSQFQSYCRSYLNGFGAARGKVLQYHKGKTTFSPSGPGIMAYVKKPWKYIKKYLILRIPKGAEIRKGKDGTRDIIAASRVVSLGRMRKKR